SPEGRTRENVQRRAPAPRCREDRRRAPCGHRRRGGRGDARDAGSGGARLHRAREGQRGRRCDRPGIERAQHATRRAGEGPREGCPPHPRRVPPLRTLNHFSFLLLVLAVTIPTLVSVAIVLAPAGDLAVPALGATIAIDLVVFGAIWLSMRPGAADITSPEQLAR